MEKVMEALKTAYAYVGGGWLGFIVYMAVGILLALVLRRIFRNLESTGKLPQQVVRLLGKALEILLWCLILVQALHSVGVDVVSILGAAGVVGVAIGFASQTVLSNVISGIFIISERSVKLGDYVNINGMEGTVEGVNLLSIHLRKADNSLVRVPCETVIKSPVVNITGDALRRCDLDVGVAYDSDLNAVRETILEVVSKEGKLLGTPAPVILFSNFADSSVQLHIGVWCKTADYHEVRFSFADSLLKAFRAKGVSIPYPTIAFANGAPAQGAAHCSK